ncbi:MAG: hypothetical protein U5K84_10050 [Alkalibacterium sp.]|nr:hypothetical protein [Alkalibacterium sp.]
MVLLAEQLSRSSWAPLYVLFASDEGSYITGQIYGITGGKPMAL